MKNKLFIFGIGKISESISYFFNRDSNYSIEGYVVDDVFATTSTFLNKPVIPLSKIDQHYVPDSFHAFVAIGYQGMNTLRSERYLHLKNQGFTFASYVSPYIKSDLNVGENTIVMDGAVIQPPVKLGNNVFIWGGSMIGHHADIKDHCWLTGGCQVGGITTIEQHSFLGVGAIIGNEITIGEKSMLGAGSITTKSIPQGSVVIAPNTEIHRLNSDQFSRMSTCFRHN